MSDLGKGLIIIGLLLVAVGILLWSGIGKGWFGQLPGDVEYNRGKFTLYFPVATCIVISLVLTLLAWLFRR